MDIYNGTADNFGTAIAKWRQMPLIWNDYQPFIKVRLRSKVGSLIFYGLGAWTRPIWLKSDLWPLRKIRCRYTKFFHVVYVFSYLPSIAEKNVYFLLCVDYLYTRIKHLKKAFHCLKFSIFFLTLRLSSMLFYSSL